MPSLSLFKLAAFLTGAIVRAAALVAWRADRRDRAQLAAELATTKKLLTAADARQRDRDAQLAQTLSALATQKRAIATPAQIIRELPKNIPLPAPVTLQADHPSAERRAIGATLKSPAASASTAASSTPKNSSVGARLASPARTTLPSNQNPADGAFLPRGDLKPFLRLYPQLPSLPG